MITDYVILGLLIFYFARGWSRGFLRTLIGPIALSLGLLSGLIYYDQTRNFTAGFLLGTLGPPLIYFILSQFYKFWEKWQKEPSPPLAIIKFLGGCLNLFWQGGLLCLTLIFITMLPLEWPWFQKMQWGIEQSNAFALMEQLSNQQLPPRRFNMKRLVMILQNPAKWERLENSREFRTIIRDKRLRRLLDNEQTRKDVKNKNFWNLFRNPDMQSILQDKEFLKGLFALNEKISDEEAELPESETDNAVQMDRKKLKQPSEQDQKNSDALTNDPSILYMQVK